MVVGLRLSTLQAPPDPLVHTLDVSSSKAKIGALGRFIEPGSALVLQRGHSRARCGLSGRAKSRREKARSGLNF
jgi:hypothetical protein